MSLGPAKGPAPGGGLPPFGPHPARKTAVTASRPSGGSTHAAREGTAASEAAHQAETEATARINEAERAVAENKAALERDYSRTREEFNQQSLDETRRQEEIYAAQKEKGRSRLEQLSRDQNAALHESRRAAERTAAQMGEFYRQNIRSVEHDGERRRTNLVEQYARLGEYEKNKNEFDLQAMQERNHALIESTRAEHDHRIKSVIEADRAEFDRIKSTSAESLDRAKEVYGAEYSRGLAEQKLAVNTLRNRTASALDAMKAGYTRDLAAYSERSEDPFYVLRDIQGRVRDMGGEFLLTAHVPPHERDGVSVAMRGDSLVVSGSRRNEESLEVGPGQVRRTAAYQTYSETFPLGWPVEPRGITREFDGDVLVVRIPKKHMNSESKPYRAAREGAPESRSPQFPENLGNTIGGTTREPAAEPGQVSVERPGSQPIGLNEDRDLTKKFRV